MAFILKKPHVFIVYTYLVIYVWIYQYQNNPVQIGLRNATPFKILLKVTILSQGIVREGKCPSEYARRGNVSRVFVWSGKRLSGEVSVGDVSGNRYEVLAIYQ